MAEEAAPTGSHVLHPSGKSRSLRPLRPLEWVLTLAIVLPALSYIAIGAYLYHQEFSDARLRLLGIARIAEEQALKLFDTNEMVLQRMLDLTQGQSDDQLLARGEDIHRHLKQMASGLTQVQLLLIQGADSRAVANSRIYPPPRHLDYTDREWYTVARSGKVASAFFTEQGISRATGEPFFDMSRRRLDAQGQFAGTVHVSLRPSYLTDFYAELAKTESGLEVFVTRVDGNMLARWPTGTHSPMRLAPDDPLLKAFARNDLAPQRDGLSSSTNAERLTVYRRLSGYPLYVVASVSTAALATAWRDGMTPLTLLALPTTLGLVWMASLALKRTRQEFESAQRLHDETERRQQAELELVKSQKLEALGRLTSGVAHDFNNVLMVMMNNLSLHQRQNPGMAESPTLKAIGRAVDSGTKLTRQLLAFSRSQLLRPQRFAFQERQVAITELLQPVLRESIKLSVSVAPDTSAIEVDVDELDLAFINLAVNAQHAMPNGGCVDVNVRNATEIDKLGPDGPFVLLEFSDNGSGIAPELVNQVFEPFFTTKLVGSGTGLGLSQVRALCESAKGGANVLPSKCGGTLIRLYFKAASPAVN